MNRSRSSCASTAGTDWWETPKPVRAPMATCCAGHGRNSSSISEFSRASFPPQDAQVHDRRFQTSEGLEEIVLNGSRLGESCWHRRPCITEVRINTPLAGLWRAAMNFQWLGVRSSQRVRSGQMRKPIVSDARHCAVAARGRIDSSGAAPFLDHALHRNCSHRRL